MLSLNLAKLDLPNSSKYHGVGQVVRTLTKSKSDKVGCSNYRSRGYLQGAVSIPFPAQTVRPSRMPFGWIDLSPSELLFLCLTHGAAEVWPNIAQHNLHFDPLSPKPETAKSPCLCFLDWNPHPESPTSQMPPILLSLHKDTNERQPSRPQTPHRAVPCVAVAFNSASVLSLRVLPEVRPKSETI